MTAVVGEQGWEHTTLDAVVRRAGVSRRTLYDSFDDKEHCFLAAAEHVMERASAAMTDAYRAAPNPREGLAEAVRWLLCFCAEDPAAARVYLVETVASGASGAARWQSHLETMASWATCAIGQLRARPHPYAGLMAVGGVYAVARRRVLEGRSQELPQLAAEVTQALWATVGVD